MSIEIKQIPATSAPASSWKNPFGDGRAAEKIGRVVNMIRRSSNGK